jgi:hypothetical protein
VGRRKSRTNGSRLGLGLGLGLGSNGSFATANGLQIKREVSNGKLHHPTAADMPVEKRHRTSGGYGMPGGVAANTADGGSAISTLAALVCTVLVVYPPPPTHTHTHTHTRTHGVFFICLCSRVRVDFRLLSVSV